MAPDPATTFALPMVTAAAFVAYHYGAPRLSASVHARRLIGLALLGALPLAIAVAALGLAPGDVGLALPPPDRAAAAIGVPYLLALPFLFLAARNPRHRAAYPLLRQPIWSARVVLANAAGWAAYLTGYEFLFRGFLLFPLAAAFGVWPALAVSTALYTLAHLTKGAGETIACLAMGLVFGAGALATGSILPPLLLHLAIAVSSDLLSVAASDEMRLDYPWRTTDR